MNLIQFDHRFYFDFYQKLEIWMDNQMTIVVDDKNVAIHTNLKEDGF